MTFAVTELSGFASKWFPFQTAKRHVTNVKKLRRKSLRFVLDANSFIVLEFYLGIRADATWLNRTYANKHHTIYAIA